MKSLLIFIIVFLHVCSPKGLFSGVPCHRPYSCVDHEDTVMLHEESEITEEKECQQLCMNFDGCVSYTWWNDVDENNSYSCKLYASCHRSYHIPYQTPFYSGL